MVANIYSSSAVGGSGDVYKPPQLGEIVRRVVDEHNKWEANLRRTTDKAVRERVNQQLAAAEKGLENAERNLEDTLREVEPGRAAKALDMLERLAEGNTNPKVKARLRLLVQHLKDQLPKSTA